MVKMAVFGSAFTESGSGPRRFAELGFRGFFKSIPVIVGEKLVGAKIHEGLSIRDKRFSFLQKNLAIQKIKFNIFPLLA
jgi:hypothetical protein